MTEATGRGPVDEFLRIPIFRLGVDWAGGGSYTLGLVIDCPFCRAPLAESTSACPHCHLDLDRARKVMGPLPPIAANGITDLSETLQGSDEKAIRAASATFSRRFPQCTLFFVLNRFPPQFPLSMHLFWLFNAGELSDETHKRGHNRDILIGLDPEQQCAGLIVGYGLEPFLPQTALERVLECATPQLQRGQFCAALTTIISQLSQLMEGICTELPTMLGLEKKLVVKTTPLDQY